MSDGVLDDYERLACGDPSLERLLRAAFYERKSLVEAGDLAARWRTGWRPAAAARSYSGLTEQAHKPAVSAEVAALTRAAVEVLFGEDPAGPAPAAEAPPAVRALTRDALDVLFGPGPEAEPAPVSHGVRSLVDGLFGPAEGGL